MSDLLSRNNLKKLQTFKSLDESCDEIGLGTKYINGIPKILRPSIYRSYGFSPHIDEELIPEDIKNIIQAKDIAIFPRYRKERRPDKTPLKIFMLI